MIDKRKVKRAVKRQIIASSDAYTFLRRVAGIVRTFAGISNPSTQFVQRAVTGRVLARVGKVEFVCNLESFSPAYDADANAAKIAESAMGTIHGRVDKKFVAAILAAYEAGTIQESRVVAHAVSVAAFAALGIASGRGDSAESQLKALILGAAEDCLGLTIPVIRERETRLRGLYAARLANGLIDIRGRKNTKPITL